MGGIGYGGTPFIPDNYITPAKLAAQALSDEPLLMWLSMANRMSKAAVSPFSAPVRTAQPTGNWFWLRSDSQFTDAALMGLLNGEATFAARHIMRHDGTDGAAPTYYDSGPELGAALSDFKVRKIVAGVPTNIASEAIDLSAGDEHKMKSSINGTAIKGFRENMSVAKFSATDSAIATGYWGLIMEEGVTHFDSAALLTRMMPAASPVARPRYFAELPVIGDGTYQSPYAPGFEGLDLPKVTWSAVIKTGRDGKPVDYRAIVRLFEGPLSDANSQAWLTACRAKAGFKEFSGSEAISEAKRLDDMLLTKDFIDSSPTEMAGWTP